MKNREKIGKMKKNKKKFRKYYILIFIRNYMSGSDLAKDLGDLCYFRGWHANRDKSNFYFKVSGFVPRTYI